MKDCMEFLNLEIPIPSVRGVKHGSPLRLDISIPLVQGTFLVCGQCLKLTGLSCKNAAIRADAVKAEYSYHIELALGHLLAFRVFGSGPSW